MLQKLILAVVFSALQISLVFGDGQSAVTSNISNLNSQIQQINQDLNSKQQQKQQIDAAIKHSQGAISQSEQLLKKLQQQRETNLKQLEQLGVTIPAATANTNAAKDKVGQAMAKIYQQIQQIENNQDSILAGNNTLEQQRKKIYLLQILKMQQDEYTTLNQKLIDLQALNQKLQVELKRLNAQLGNTSQKHEQLLAVKDQNLKQANKVQQQIVSEKSQLSHLKQRQAQLNQLLKQLAAAEKLQRQQEQGARKAAARKAAQAKAQARKQAQPASQATTNPIVANDDAEVSITNNNPSKSTPPAGKAQQAAEADNVAAPAATQDDNSPFMARKLAKPVAGTIAVAYGQMRDSVKNNGVLVTPLDNTPVYAVSNGVVLFSGELPGFGQIIVIDNGDSYTSVYSGVLATVKKGSTVRSGQQIAASGSSANQPMGGVYFELRHLGQPVNPSRLFR